jgi:ankyrin repeat protein
MSIHDAAAGGHIKAIKQHLATGTDVNAKDTNEWTPLHLAALNGQKETIEILIDEGAEVNVGDIHTLLHYAAQYGEKEISNYLSLKVWM